MRDLVIPASRLRTELWTILVCFVTAVCINIGSIIHFHTPFTEVFSQIGFTVIITAVLYAVWTVLRILCWLVSLPFKKKA